MVRRVSTPTSEKIARYYSGTEKSLKTEYAYVSKTWISSFASALTDSYRDLKLGRTDPSEHERKKEMVHRELARMNQIEHAKSLRRRPGSLGRMI